MEEIWRHVVGYEGFYEISNLGNLVRVSTYGGKTCRKPRAAAHKKGYRCFHMCANGVRKYRLAHIMVWEAFKGRVPDGLELNHCNSDRNDPALTNLETVTRAENIQHSFRTTKRSYNVRPQLGENHGLAKLTNEDVIRIRELYEAGHTRRDIANTFGVTYENVSAIAQRKTWRHI